LIAAVIVLIACFGIVATVRLVAIIAYLAVVGAQVSRQGPKLEGLVSVGLAVLFNLPLLIPIRVLGSTGHHEPSLESQQIAEALGLILLVLWMASAVIAIRSRRQPNRALGWLALGAVWTPGLLAYLDHCQYLVCARVGIEWSRFRPCEILMHWLWGL